MFAYAQRISVFALSVTALFAQTAPVPEVRTSGMIGVAFGQTARINVLNKGVLPPAVGVVCTVALTFYDEQGNALKSSSVKVDPGAAGYLDLFGDVDLALAANQRKEIRATISIPAVTPAATSSSASIPSVCRLTGTLEVFDTLTGRTEAVIGGMHVVPGVVATADTRR